MESNKYWRLDEAMDEATRKGDLIWLEDLGFQMMECIERNNLLGDLFDNEYVSNMVLEMQGEKPNE
jgi:hypothetical protein